jgi:hypothetical protein
MIKCNIFKGLALPLIVMSTSVMANVDSLSPNMKDQLDIEQVSGVYFESDTLRENSVTPELRDFPFKIQHPDTLPLDSSDKFFATPEATLKGFSATKQYQAEAMATAAERSGCPTLALDSAVYTNFTAQGQFQCYSVEITTATKIEGLLANIPADVDYNLYLFKLEDDNSFTMLDFANSPTATLEKAIQKVDPGAYILAAQATQGVSATSAIMGWFSYPDFDQQESNDKISQATALSTTATIQGNIDNANDLDYFTYQVGANQSKLYFTFSASEQFIFELWTGSAWAKISNNQLISLNVTANGMILFAARGVTDNLPPVSAQYALTITDPSSATMLKSAYIWNNEHFTDLLFTGYQQAHQYLGMSGTVTNDNGQPVPFAEVVLTANYGDNEVIPNSEVEIGRTIVRSDNDGKFSVAMTLPDCAGSEREEVRNRTYGGSQTNTEQWWIMRYNEAKYKFELKNANGVAIDTKGYDFTHLCSETLTKTCYDYRNPVTGEMGRRCF